MNAGGRDARWKDAKWWLLVSSGFESFTSKRWETKSARHKNNYLRRRLRFLLNSSLLSRTYVVLGYVLSLRIYVAEFLPISTQDKVLHSWTSYFNKINYRRNDECCHSLITLKIVLAIHEVCRHRPWIKHFFPYLPCWGEVQVWQMPARRLMDIVRLKTLTAKEK